MSAYKDEQDKLDDTLEKEIVVWRQIKQVLDANGFDIQLSLANGLPDMTLVKI